MKRISYEWLDSGTTYALDLAYVAGTEGSPYSFGQRSGGREIEISGFFIATVPTTQALWMHVMGAGSNPALHRGMDLPAENVAWDELTRSGGFLDRINQNAVREEMAAKAEMADARFRLPTETEWEYAARGGPHWRDEYPFSGSGDIDQVAWYDRRHGDHTQPVARKAPNQLGICDMSGNALGSGWCSAIPRAVAPLLQWSPDAARRLVCL